MSRICRKWNFRHWVSFGKGKMLDCPTNCHTPVFGTTNKVTRTTGVYIWLSPLSPEQTAVKRLHSVSMPHLLPILQFRWIIFEATINSEAYICATTNHVRHTNHTSYQSTYISTWQYLLSTLQDRRFDYDK